MYQPPNLEGDWWRVLSQNTTDAVRWKARLDHNFANIQRYLIENNGLRSCINDCATEGIQGLPLREPFDALDEVHPRALALIAKYGQEFKPYLWGKVHFDEPKPLCCFGNSFFRQYCFNKHMREIGDTARMSYVEGVAINGRGCYAMLHAWNSIGPNGFDWTWYAITGWAIYLGIPLTEREYRRARRFAYPETKGNNFHLLFKKEVFPNVERFLTDLCERKARQSQTKAAA